MSISKKPVSDVFVSYIRKDEPVARRLAAKLVEEGLSVFYEPQPAGALFTEEIRKAIAESPVFIVVVSEKSLRSPNIAVEVGAATAWSKAIFPVRHGISSVELPLYLRPYKSFSSVEVKALTRAVRKGLSPLTRDQIRTLRKLYVDFGVPSDRLASEPASLERITKKFNTTESSSFSSERLLQEIVRQRKRGYWPRLSRGKGE